MSGYAPGLPTDILLPSLRDTWGEWAWWFRPDTETPIPIKGRFRIDPAEAPLGSSLAPGVNAVQTWFYCAGLDVPCADRWPGMSDLLFIRDEWWEIVLIDADDIGELGYRLLKAADRDGDPAAPVPV